MALPPSMYKLSGAPQAGSQAALPTNLTTLGLSWLNRRFEAVAVTKGVTEATWRCSRPVEDLDAFAAAVKEAVAATHYQGSTARLLLAHPRQGMQWNEAPPAKGAAWQRVLERLAQRQKTFEGEAAWSYQPTHPAKHGLSLILHLWPKNLLDDTIRACARAGLELGQVTPASAVLHGALPLLPLEGEQVALLAADLQGTALLVAGRRDGALLLARLLPSSWNGKLEAFAVDLNRTLLFINEQFGVAPGSIYLFGKGAAENQEGLQAQTSVPVHLPPIEEVPGFWATELLRLPAELTPNLISAEQRQAPKRKAMLNLTTWVVLALFLGSLGILAWSQMMIGRARKSITELKRQELTLAGQHKELQARFAELSFKQEVSRVLLDQRPAPVPAWFLGYLSEVFPEQLQLESVRVQQDEELWRTELQLVLQPQFPDDALPAAVASLTNRLGQSPLYLVSMPSAKVAEPAAPARVPLGRVLGEWAQRVKPAPANRVTPAARSRTLEGVMQ